MDMLMIEDNCAALFESTEQCGRTDFLPADDQSVLLASLAATYRSLEDELDAYRAADRPDFVDRTFERMDAICWRASEIRAPDIGALASKVEIFATVLADLESNVAGALGKSVCDDVRALVLDAIRHEAANGG